MSDFAIKATSGLFSGIGEHPNHEASVARERQNKAEGGNVLPPTTAKQATTTQSNDREKDFSKLLENKTTQLRFQPSATAERTLITVRDTASGEVVRQIPSKAVVAIAAYIEQYLADVAADSATKPLIDDVE